MAVDCDNGKIWWAKNGTWGSSGNPATGANQALTFTATDDYKIQVAGASGNVSDITSNPALTIRSFSLSTFSSFSLLSESLSLLL